LNLAGTWNLCEGAYISANEHKSLQASIYLHERAYISANEHISLRTSIYLCERAYISANEHKSLQASIYLRERAYISANEHKFRSTSPCNHIYKKAYSYRAIGPTQSKLFFIYSPFEVFTSAFSFVATAFGSFFANSMRRSSMLLRTFPFPEKFSNSSLTSMPDEAFKDS